MMGPLPGLRILGAGGHARVAAAAWQSADGVVAAFHDDDPAQTGRLVLGIEVAGAIADAFATANDLHIAIGCNAARAAIAAPAADNRFPVIQHATAWAHRTVHIGSGTLIGAGALVQVDASIGRHCIINTGAIVEHDNRIGDFVHIAPGAALGGDVTVGDATLIGLGARIKPGTTIGNNAIVGAGATVVRDIANNTVVTGTPARPLPD